MSSSSALHAGEAIPTKSEIVVKLKQWRHAFATIRVEFSVTDREGYVERHPHLASEGDLFGKWGFNYNFLWTDYGAVRYGWQNVNDGNVKLRNLSGTDGEIRYHARQEASSGEVWDELSVSRPKPGENRPNTEGLIAMDGLWFGEGRWIDEHLESGDTWTVAGWTDVDGVQCIELVEHVETEGLLSHTHLYLDPAHDYLPRKVWRYGDDSAIGMLTDVKEFQMLPKGTWFPKAGRTWFTDEPQETDDEWLITNVELNPHLPPSKMGPPKPTAGVTQYVGEEGVVRLWGADRAKTEAMIAYAANMNIEQPSIDASNIIATPEQALPWSWILIVVSTILFLVAWKHRH